MRAPALLIALLALAAAPPAGAEQLEELELPTRDGDTVHVEIARPDGDAKVPVILSYSPYNTLGGNPVGNLASGSAWVEKGYARAYADVIGTRNSTGCWDYGGLKEQRSGVDVVNALAKQPWTNGKVAMTGVSYEGTTATMVAAAGAEAAGLAAIVPVAGISRWYGYAYQDGVRYALNSEEVTDEGIDTPLGFDFGFGRTPPDRPGSAAAFIDRLNPCDALDHTMHGYSETPDYDEFWLQRDYRKDAARFRVPVMVVHGWQDYNVKQSEGVDLFEQLPVDNPATAAVEGVPFKLLHMHQAPHGDGDGDEYTKRVDDFFARTLKGEANEVEYREAVRSQGRREGTAEKFTRTSSWPPPGTRAVSLQLGERDGSGILEPDVAGGAAEFSFTDTGTATEEAALAAYPQTLPGQLVYVTKPLEEDVRLAGTAVLRARVKLDGAAGHLAPTLVDIGPDDGAVAITRGFLNLLYRGGLARSVPVPAGDEVEGSVRFAPQDQTVAEGHRIGLVVASSNTVWAVPPRERREVTVLHSGSRLELPLVGPVPDPVAGPSRPVAPGRPRARLTVSVRRVRAGVIRVSGRAPARARLTVRLRRGARSLAIRRVTVPRSGRWSVRMRARGDGRVRAVVSARLIGGRRLSARSRAIAPR